jgi:flagellum-specific peptidoglycan hydrolase FlgJ
MDIGVGLRGAWSFEKTGSSSIPSDWTTGADFTATPGSSLSITGDTSSAVAPSVDQMGIFAKMGNIANNLMASIFNGKQVDMYAADTATTDTSNNSGGTTPTGDATWNGTQYDLSKYNMSDLSEKKQNHINKIIQPALHTYKTHNLLPSVTIAQSVGESGWGPSSGLATKGNNLFGIKCGSKWTGKAYTAKTGEFLNGKNVTITDSFRAYDSMADSVIDRANFLSASRYKAMMTKNTAQEQFQAMKDGGYATDPNYVSKMMKIVNDSKLTRFDTPKPPVEASGAATTPSGDAGKGEGDGKTYMVQPSKAKHTGNTTALTGADKAAYANAKRAIDKLDRQISTAMNNQNATPNITGEYVDVLAAIVEQLQAINSNTANTARGISNIEIVSANEPISSGGKPAVNNKKPIDTRQANGNTGYDIARKMASYK